LLRSPNQCPQLVDELLLVSVLLRGGSFYPPRSLPKGIKRGAFGQCFDNSRKLAKKKGWTYCEGVALTGKYDVVQPHAWCVDQQGNVVDPTWEETGLAYLGLTDEEIAKEGLEVS